MNDLRRSSKKQRKRNIKAEIRQAICYDEFEKIKDLLPFINDPIHDKKLKTLLIYSLLKDKMNIFEYFIKTMKINYYQDDIGFTILYELTLLDRLHNIDIHPVLALTKNINNRMIDGGGTVLYYYVPYISKDRKRNGRELYIKTLNILLEHGADPYIMIDEESIISRETRAYNVDIDICTILLNNNKMNKFVGMRALVNVLLHQVEDNKYDIIEMLLPHISDINELYEGHSVLWHAKNNGNSDIIELLEIHGAL